MKNRLISILFTISISGLSLSLLFIFLLLPFTLKANSLETTHLVPQDFQTIQEAVNNASDGDTIYISTGVYTENITISAKNLFLDGAGIQETIIDGNASGQALIIINNADVTINNLTIRNGYATRGGGINAEESQLSIYNSLLINNNTFDFQSSLGSGAAIFAVDADLTISNSQLISNTSSGGSGAIYFQANLRPSALAIYHSQILSNSTGGSGGGISIFNNPDAPSPLISHSTIAHNSSFSGGGVRVLGLDSPAPLKVVNSTISHNEGSSYGGGLLVYTEAHLEQTTIIGNQPSGVHLASGDLVLSSSIIANDGNDCNSAEQSSISSIGYNISSDSSCQLDQSSDFSNTDPLVGPLENNGGSTWTHALLSNSPALDAAADCSIDDQRGRPRSTISCDTGAYEAQPYANDDLVLTRTPIISVTVDVLANDLAGLTGTLNLGAVSLPANGIASIVDQQIVYTPTTGFIGTEVMTYTINDDVITSTARLTVIIDSILFLPFVIRQ